ncbi:hypothetical protein BKA67DRAFT_108312 [Truncatella angustata]|uniref:Uncharacterized protein n=1 Tax=Truncatella angustata TaxID=152316 RepID=A0A9P8UC28_9PEZI|nr:uncharacterized protein BKA67DRAFT_108312 [Truncatella angustata]KAH6645262.1 hypothetical protein BKA67DRAFT_108312 [Truncatella angustata]
MQKKREQGPLIPQRPLHTHTFLVGEALFITSELPQEQTARRRGERKKKTKSHPSPQLSSYNSRNSPSLQLHLSRPKEDLRNRQSGERTVSTSPQSSVLSPQSSVFSLQSSVSSLSLQSSVFSLSLKSQSHFTFPPKLTWLFPTGLPLYHPCFCPAFLLPCFRSFFLSVLVPSRREMVGALRNPEDMDHGFCVFPLLGYCPMDNAVIMV